MPVAFLGSGRFPCIFPMDQGFGRRDGFAPDSPHRQLVCGCRDFPPVLANSPRNPRDSARSWGSSPRVSEPETADSGPGRRRVPCSSLLPGLAVRFRREIVDSPRGTGPCAPPALLATAGMTSDRIQPPCEQLDAGAWKRPRGSRVPVSPDGFPGQAGGLCRQGSGPPPARSRGLDRFWRFSSSALQHRPSFPMSSQPPIGSVAAHEPQRAPIDLG
jgi:hypothetical protein